MDASSDARNSMLDWSETDVHAWLSSIGYPQYEAQIREHRISGDMLVLLNPDSLKEIGISTVGQRLAILKNVYALKVAHNIPISPDDYVPPSECDEEKENLSLDRLHDMVKVQGERLRAVEEENGRLNDTLAHCLEELQRAAVGRSPSYKWPQFNKPARSPTKTETLVGTESPHPSPQKSEYDMSKISMSSITSQPSSQISDRSGPYRSQSSSSISPNTAVSQLTPSVKSHSRSDGAANVSGSDNMKSFKVSLDDPAWKVLPAALKKYKINNDDWQNYAMFICYGTTERCLSYDEKPLLLFQKLKDAKKNPVFMLKHIKDIRSPIAVAAQKQAQRKAAEAQQSTTKSSPSHAHSRSVSRPAKLQMHGLNNANVGTPPLNTAVSTNMAWPEIMSPATESKKDETATHTSMSSTSTVVASEESPDASTSTATVTVNPKDSSVVSTGVSFAVAIYPYMAEQEDEFDVVVGDTFVIYSRARGWWVVQRDPGGTGNVDVDTGKQGWVPAGCLLETNVPVATAVADARAARASNATGTPTSPVSKTPILPLSILSTSFPGVALMDYRKKGEEELDLSKDDLLRVFKRYNHWSYAVKEEDGDRGWVPSWYIGKVSNSGGVPPTPVTTAPVISTSQQAQVPLESELRYASTPGSSDGAGAGGSQQNGHGPPQVSPMSSAFPLQSRTTAVV